MFVLPSKGKRKDPVTVSRVLCLKGHVEEGCVAAIWNAPAAFDRTQASPRTHSAYEANSG
jgi:hypothetical protein